MSVRFATLDQVLRPGEAWCSACDTGPFSSQEIQRHRRTIAHEAQARRWAERHGYQLAAQAATVEVAMAPAAEPSLVIHHGPLSHPADERCPLCLH